jgi:SAM-dependent methyltransferase
MNLNISKQEMNSQVKELYEVFPYPHYPLWFRPRWIESPQSSSYVCQSISHVRGNQEPIDSSKKNILLMGCGDMQPYILAHWEPRHHHLWCVDLSQKSLDRARFRLLTAGSHLHWICDDIDHFLGEAKARSLSFDHVDAYGVLHHLSSPDRTLTMMSDCLRPHGTVRVMVYNHRARDWIHSLQNVFKQMGLQFQMPEDVRVAQSVVDLLAKVEPFYGQKITQFGRENLQNKSRFVDTFLHCQELRLSLEDWFHIFAQSGLEPVGLFDRYGELDDLANPMWSCPTPKSLAIRAEDKRYENNLEIVLKKKMDEPFRPYSRVSGRKMKWKSPPQFWFSYLETKGVSFFDKRTLWHTFVDHVFEKKSSYADTLVRDLDLHCAQRLARVGAILPGMIKDSDLKLELIKPLADSMEVPVLSAWQGKEEALFCKVLAGILRDKGKDPDVFIPGILADLKIPCPL